MEASYEHQFERGFKSWAENSSVNIRRQLGLLATDPLCPRALAEVLNVRVWTPEDVPDLPVESLSYLLSDAGNEWSAVSVVLNGMGVVVINSCHSKPRQASDIMHELAHLVRGHEPSHFALFEDTDILLRTYKPQYEAEADWLAGALLLPRPALVHCKRNGLNLLQAQEHYGVSAEMVRYRASVTGVAKQYGVFL